MASSNTWMLSLTVALISTGVLVVALGLKFVVPLVLDFSVSQAPLLWTTFRSWLKPPYLYVIINGIIITIAASSRFHQKNNGESEQTEDQMQQHPMSKISVDQQPPVEFGLVETKAFEAETNVAIVHGGSEFELSKSDWIPSEVMFPVTKPPVTSSFGHRKPLKASPEGSRTLRVAKPKRHETLENTWKMITEGRAMPLNRHLKKPATWDNHGRDINVYALAESSPLMKKSEMFRDWTNYQPPPVQQQVNYSPASGGKLRKESSLSQDELNRRVEAFIKKFNDEMRMQRQESLNQYMEMVNR